jgi:aerobic carbon-monoxide dehydrogenase large subunit
VVAETLEQAKAAAELIEVDYDELPAVVDTATAAGRRPRCTTKRPTTSATQWGIGDKAGGGRRVRQGRARHHAEFRNNRLVPNAMEPRAANAATPARRQLHAVRQPTRTRTSSGC